MLLYTPSEQSNSRSPASRANFQCLTYIVKNVLNILNAYRQTDEVRSNASLAQLLVRELTVRVACRMKHTGACIGHMGHDVNHVERVHEAYGGVAVSLQAESNDAARTVRQVFRGKLMISVAGQSAVMYPCHTVIGLQKLGNLLSVGTMLLHAQMKRLQTEVQDERVHGRRNGSEVAHELSHKLGDVAHLAKLLGVGQPVITVIGSAQAGELVGIGEPVEIAAVYHAATHLTCCSVHIFCGAVCHDVGAPFKRTTVDRCGESVVDDEGHTVLVSYACKLLNVEHGTSGVTYSLAKHHLCVRTECLLDLLLRVVGINEGAVDTQLLESDPKQVECAAINRYGHQPRRC